MVIDYSKWEQIPYEGQDVIISDYAPEFQEKFFNYELKDDEIEIIMKKSEDIRWKWEIEDQEIDEDRYREEQEMIDEGEDQEPSY